MTDPATPEVPPPDEGDGAFAAAGETPEAEAPAEIAEVRGASSLPFLIPGVGAQGGDLVGSVKAAWTGDPASCLVASSRSIMFADKPWREAANLKEQINAVVGALR